MDPPGRFKISGELLGTSVVNTATQAKLHI